MGCCVGGGACFGKKSKWACDARCSSCGCGRIIGGATLSEGAGTRIRTLLDQRQREYLRLGVMVRGCNGLTYTLVLCGCRTTFRFMSHDDRGKFDEIIEDKGVKVLTDPRALVGTKMDYIDDQLQSEFVFINPNSKGQCGCGESFTT